MECLRAIQKLLKSSRPVISTRDHSLYERTGGYKQALRDFDELHPTDVISLKVLYIYLTFPFFFLSGVNSAIFVFASLYNWCEISKPDSLNRKIDSLNL